MTPKEFILMCMSVEGKMIRFNAPQIQKMIFISQDKTQEEKIFNFYPHDYGPFDHTIFEQLNAIKNDRLLDIISDDINIFYCVTEKGLKEGKKIFKQLPKNQQKYLKKLSKWIRSISFPELIGAVYKSYPEFGIKSVFSEFRKKD